MSTGNIRFDVIRQALAADADQRANLLTNYRRAMGGQKLDKYMAAALLGGAAGLTGIAATTALTAPAARKKPVVDPKAVIQSELAAIKGASDSADVLGHLTSDPMAPVKAVGLAAGGGLLASLLLKQVKKQNPTRRATLPGLSQAQSSSLDQAKAEFEAALAAEKLLAKRAAWAVMRGLEMGAVGPDPLPASALGKQAEAGTVTDSEPRQGVVMTPLALALAAGGGLAATSGVMGILKGIKAHKKRQADMRRTISRYDQLKPDQLTLAEHGFDGPDRNVITL